MSLQFETLKEEKIFDHYAAEWVTRYRHPGTADLAKVLARAYENLNGALPSVSAFERAYRELHADGEVALVTEKLVEPTVAKSEILTVDEYRRIPAAEIARRYMTNRAFKSQVDALISAGKI